MTGRSSTVPNATGAIIPEPVPQNNRAPSPITERVQDQLDDLKTIYREPSPQLLHAVTLLSEAAKACADALEAEDRVDRFRADDCMLRVQALVGELIGFRGIGDGFGIVATALMFAFINKSGIPFTKSEMQAVLRTLNSLRTGPFASMETAVAVTGILEKARLVIDPIPLGELFTEAQEAGFVDSE
jgi:hypothetical protein